MTLEVLKQKIFFKRDVYGIFDWMGDVGGFIESMYFLGRLLVFSFSQNFFEGMIVKSLYLVQESSKEMRRRSTL